MGHALEGCIRGTIEVLGQRGIAERFLSEGKATQVQSFAGIPLDISDFPTRHNYGLALMQSDFERILAGWVNELGVTIMREHPLGDAWSSRRIRARHPSDDPNDS
jgi:3-(3-hydroxy-phenyl)propionate hydroxylase